MIKWLRRLGLAVVVAIAVVVVLRVGFGLHVYMDGDFRPHLAFGKPSAHYDALEAQRAAQRAAPAPAPRRPRPPPTRAAAGGDGPPPRSRRARRGHAAVPPPPRHAAPPAGGVATGAPPAAVAGSWTEYPRPGPRRRLPPAPRRRDLAGRRPAPALEAADRRRARVVRGRARRRLHDRAAPHPGGGRRLRRRHRPRTLDERLGRVLLGSDGRRRPAGHADLRRRHPLRPRRGRRAARAAGRLRHARVAHQHPRRRRRGEPAVGHVRRAPDRRRQGDRAARRPRRVDGRLRRRDRQGRVEVARRPAGLRLAHAGDARRPTPDRDHHRQSRDRRVGRRRRAVVELPVGDGQRDQRRAADRDRAVAALPLVRLWQGRGGDRADRRRATGCRRRRSGSTRG